VKETGKGYRVPERGAENGGKALKTRYFRGMESIWKLYGNHTYDFEG